MSGYIVNPDAVGNFDAMPVVQLSGGIVAALRRAGLVCGCGGMNGHHDTACTKDACRSCLGYGGGFDIDGDPSPEPCQDCNGSGTQGAPQ